MGNKPLRFFFCSWVSGETKKTRGKKENLLHFCLSKRKNPMGRTGGDGAREDREGRGGWRNEPQRKEKEVGGMGKEGGEDVMHRPTVRVMGVRRF